MVHPDQQTVVRLHIRASAGKVLRTAVAASPTALARKGKEELPRSRTAHFPRYAAAVVEAHYGHGERGVFLSGGPLAGKSNAIRDFAARTEQSEQYATFMLSSGPHGAGLFQRLANLLSAALDWDVDARDVRQWLRRQSRAPNGPALVLAIDDGVTGSAVAADIEEIAESGFGERLCLLLTCDFWGKAVG